MHFSRGRQRGKRMVKCWWLFIMALVISGWTLPSDVQAAETIRKWTINNHINKLQAIPIPGLPGRVIGFYERLGKAEFEDGETATQILRCTFDMVRGVGSFQGYGALTFKDGSTTLVKIEGTMNPPKEGLLPTGQGKGTYVDGTGRFKGIQGKLSFEVTMLKPYGGESKGDALVKLSATYTLPEK